MNPLFFGPSARPLFGVYHPPLARAAQPRSVLLCAPMGQEYIRAHRAFRQLSIQLARTGHHVLRFDYGGVGDSAGDGTDVSLEGWRRDINAAAEELQDSSGTTKVSLVGLRLGATLALQACASLDVDQLVLWDPVTDGGTYLRELFDTYEVPLADQSRARNGALIGIGGFPVPPDLLRGIEAIEAGYVPNRVASRILVICSTPDPAAEALARNLEAAGSAAVYEEVPMGGRWDDADTVGAVLLPQAIIRSIATFLS